MNQVGWDELLRTRSAVFVMEEEYRMQKAQSEAQTNASTTVIHEDGSVTHGEGSTLAAKDADDDASTKGVRSAAATPSHSPKESVPNGGAAADADVDAVTNGIPTIRISTESNRERAKQEPDAADAEAETNGAAENGQVDAAGHALEKPVQAAGGEDNQADATGGQGAHTPQEAFSFTNKRLCERWLDNLFMVLYEVRCCYIRLYAR